MSLSQEDLRSVYQRIKRIVDEINTTNKSKAEVASAIRSKIKTEFLGNLTYIPRGGGYLVGSRGDRKFKRFVKPKYRNIGLPSIEQRMLDKMIDSVVDGLKLNEEGFLDLDNAVAKASACVSRAESINRDCEKVLAKINKIPDFLETGKWDAEDR